MNELTDKLKKRASSADPIEQRLIRIETKISAMMFTLGLDGHGKPINKQDPEKVAALKDAAERLLDYWQGGVLPDELSDLLDVLDKAVLELEE